MDEARIMKNGEIHEARCAVGQERKSLFATLSRVLIVRWLWNSMKNIEVHRPATCHFDQPTAVIWCRDEGH